MRGNASRFPDKRLSVAQAEVQLAMWLANARPDMIAAATVDDLARRYRVPERVIEAKLLAAQDRIRRAAVGAPI